MSAENHELRYTAQAGQGWFDQLDGSTSCEEPNPKQPQQKYTIQTFVAKIQTRLQQIQVRRMFFRTYISTIYPQNVRTRSWPTDDERETRRCRTSRQGAYSVKTKTKPAIIKIPRRKNLAPAVHPLQSSLESTSSDSEHQEASEVGCGWLWPWSAGLTVSVEAGRSRQHPVTRGQRTNRRAPYVRYWKTI